MVCKINIAQGAKTWKIEIEENMLIGKSIGEKFNGGELNDDFEGYEFKVSGGSDKSGFPMYDKIEGIGLKRVLFGRGWGMHVKKSGLRKRKTVRGKSISDATSQVNLVLLNEGQKKLVEIFPDQNKPKVEDEIIEESKSQKEELPVEVKEQPKKEGPKIEKEEKKG
jgi:small subunit ribosomal protein S6e